MNKLDLISKFLKELISLHKPQYSFDIVCGKCGSKECEIALLPVISVNDKVIDDVPPDYGFKCTKCGFSTKAKFEQCPQTYG